MQGLTVLLSVFWSLFFASRFHGCAATPSQNFLPQGFFFDWNPPGTTVPIPITQQCDTLHITWGRTSAGEGPNAVSPYYLQIFLSTFVVPIIVPAGNGPSFDFAVPWVPGTQYQICMWDSSGVTGGCQDIYTVIPSANSSTPTCSNVTYPASTLNVSAAVINGAFSQYGWPPQCTDIQVQGKNGTPPYTLTVAPTLHTPLNLTTNSTNPINWTITLSHGAPFFIAVTDAHGNSWSQGPLHSGDNADTACLDIHHTGGGGSSSTNVAATVGAAIGGIVVGLLVGAAGIFAFMRWRRTRRTSSQDMIRDPHSPVHPQSAREMTSTGGPAHMAGGGGLEYLVEPFAMPSSSSDPNFPLLPGSSGVPSSPPDATSASGSDPTDQSGQGRRQNVYVVHHDGGRAPVTVYTAEGAEVVELPPRYPEGSTTGPSERGESDTSRGTYRRREPGPAPRKARGPRTPTSPSP